jgi:hypothetical protein
MILKAPDASLILISRTPEPIVFIGFQSAGSLPFCTSRNWKPAVERASSGKFRKHPRLSPKKAIGFMDSVYQNRYSLARKDFVHAETRRRRDLGFKHRLMQKPQGQTKACHGNPTTQFRPSALPHFRVKL